MYVGTHLKHSQPSTILCFGCISNMYPCVFIQPRSWMAVSKVPNYFFWWTCVRDNSFFELFFSWTPWMNHRDIFVLGSFFRQIQISQRYFSKTDPTLGHLNWFLHQSTYRRSLISFHLIIWMLVWFIFTHMGHTRWRFWVE